MESKNLIAGVLAITVTVIITASLLVPVLADTTRTSDTFTNEGMYYIEYNGADTHTIEYEQLTSGSSLTVDGSDVTLTTNLLGCTIVAGDNFIVRYVPSENVLQFKGNNQYITAITELSGTITATSFDATCVSSGTSKTISATTENIYSCTATETDLIMSNYNVPVYVNGDSEIFGFGQNVVGSTLVLLKIYGNVDDGVTVEVRNPSTGEISESYTVSNIVVDSEEVDGYLDLYQLNKVTFSVTDGTNTADITFSAYVVPSETTAELSQHLGTAEIALINVLPVLVIVSIVLMAVGLVYVRRD